MIAETKYLERRRSFRAALDAHGSTHAAEHAVLDGIAATEFEVVGMFSFGTVKAANPTAL